MAGKGRGKKRKSEDFICEIDPKDLSSDEDDNVRSPSSKISKIDGNSMKTSKTEDTSSSKTCSESVILLTDESDDMRSTQISIEESIDSSQDSSEVRGNENKPPETSNNPGVVEIDENCADLSCVIIVEDHIPVMVVSDDDIEEEGEIVENLVVVDEVCATPKQKSPKSKTPVKDEVQNTPDDAEEEYHVVEEIGPSPMPKQLDHLINISFRCEKTMNQYGHLLVNFLKSFPEIEVKKDKLSIRVNEKEIFDDTKTPRKKNKKKKPKKDLFVVDTNPSSNDDNSQFLQFKYNSKFEINDPEKSETVAVNSAASSKVCFNCDGDHALRDCGVPKNHHRINQARQQFLNKYKTVRYHVEQNQKLGDLKPGVISENLRKALGLNKNEIPNYIYRMRHLGYPPGWLEEAKVTPSDLTLFDIDGEKVENRKTKKEFIDPSKIIDYPGFNVPLKKGFHDDFRRHNVKPYSKALHKSSMIKYFEEISQKEDVEESSSDMDISKTEIQEKKSLEKTVKAEASAPVNSPSLLDLEEKKKELLDKLNSSEEQAKSTSNDGEADVSQDTVDGIIEKKSSIAVKNTELGTPILKSSSPYSRLPNPDNFSVGVSPVIDFENLPNSTGKYEELSKVLSKVRMTMKNIL